MRIVKVIHKMFLSSNNQIITQPQLPSSLFLLHFILTRIKRIRHQPHIRPFPVQRAPNVYVILVNHELVDPVCYWFLFGFLVALSLHCHRPPFKFGLVLFVLEILPYPQTCHYSSFLYTVCQLPLLKSPFVENCRLNLSLFCHWSHL